MRYLCRASRGAGECVNSMETVRSETSRGTLGTRAVAGETLQAACSSLAGERAAKTRPSRDVEARATSVCRGRSLDSPDSELERLLMSHIYMRPLRARLHRAHHIHALPHCVRERIVRPDARVHRSDRASLSLSLTHTHTRRTRAAEVQSRGGELAFLRMGLCAQVAPCTTSCSWRSCYGARRGARAQRWAGRVELT